MPSPGIDFLTLVTRLRAMSAMTQTEAQARINQAYRRFARRSQAVRKTIAVGNTVVNTNTYALTADILQIHGLRINALRYEEKSVDEIRDLLANEAYIVGRRATGRMYGVDYHSDGGGDLIVYPTPVTVMPISLRAAVMPDDMANMGAGAEYPKLPIDFHEDLIDGGFAIGLGRDDEDFGDRQGLLAEFDARADYCRGELTSRRARGVARVKLVR